MEGPGTQPAPGCAAGLEAEVHQTCVADPESLLVVKVKLVEEPPDALVTADVKDAAAVQQMNTTAPAVAAAAEPGCEAGSAVSAYLADEPIFAAAVSESGTSSAAAGSLVNEPRSFAAKLVGEAAVKPLDESHGAVAVVLVGELSPASGVQTEMDPVAEEQAEDGLKCFQWHRAHCEDS